MAERRLDARDDLVLLAVTDIFGGDDVGIVRAPIADADFAVFLDNSLEADRRSRRRVKQRLAFIGGGPLRPSDEVPATNLRENSRHRRLGSGDQRVQSACCLDEWNS